MCIKPAKRICKTCRVVAYCSPECLKRDFQIHSRKTCPIFKNRGELFKLAYIKKQIEEQIDIMKKVVHQIDTIPEVNQLREKARASREFDRFEFINALNKKSAVLGFEN